TSLTPEQLQYIHVLKFSSESLLALINDILDFSRIESGNIQLNEKPFNLHALLHSVVYSLQYKAAEKGLMLEVKMDDKLPVTLFGDSVKIGQVLTNLLSNAIKFTEQGSIWLSLQLLDRQKDRVQLLFAVKDSGIGISEDQQEKIFEAFTQASPEINLKYGGSGLGLSISQQLLKLYGSMLVVNSRPGKGSEFSFRLELPIVTAAEESHELAPAESAVNAVRGLRILLAEDNPINVLVVTAYLKEWGVKFDVVKNGSEALLAVKQKDYAIVFMDLQMPEMDGYEATRAIRNLDAEKYRRLPIVAFTASAKADYRDRIIEAGINDLLSKPFRPEALLATIINHTKTEKKADAPDIWPDTVPEDVTDPAHLAEDGAVINLDQYRKIARNSQETLDKLLRLTIRHFEDYKKDFSEALQARDSKQLGESAHKIKMTLNILKANRLEVAISTVRRLVEVAGTTNEALHEADQLLQKELDAAIQVMKQAL
ncbi:MAG: response regulator, partial [Bacteroidetes bacterium]|nr:response regulator [Bacteroidota bacterium]